jgi:hypothetical protein
MKNATTKTTCVKCGNVLSSYSSFQYTVNGAIHVNEDNKIFDCAEAQTNFSLGARS